MAKVITFDLGHNIGTFDIPSGTIVLIEQAMPILIRSLKKWKSTDVKIKNGIMTAPLSMFLKIHAFNDVENPDVIIYESDEFPIFNKESVSILLQTESYFDYKITLNGIYNSKNELIKEYTFLTESNNMMCQYSGLDAYEGFFGFNIKHGLSCSLITNYKGHLNPIVENYMISQLKMDSSNQILHIGDENTHNLQEIEFGSQPIFDSMEALDNYLQFIWNECILLWDTLGFRYRRPFLSNISSLTNATNQIIDFLNEFVKDQKIRMEIIAMISSLKYPIGLGKKKQFFVSKKQLMKLTKLEILMFETMFKRRRAYLIVEINEEDKDPMYYKYLEILFKNDDNRSNYKKIFIANMRKDSLYFGVNKIIDENLIISEFAFTLKKGEDRGGFKVHTLSEKSDNGYKFIANGFNYRYRGFIFNEKNKNSYFNDMGEIIQYIEDSDFNKLKLSKKILNQSDCYEWSVLHLLLIYSRNFNFLKESFDYIVKTYPLLYNENKNYLIHLIENNNNLNDSDLIYFVEYFFSTYKKNYPVFEGSPYYLLDRIKYICDNEIVESPWFESLYVRNLPIKLLDHMANDEKIKFIGSKKQIRYYYGILNSTDLTFITNNIFGHSGKKIKKYYLDSLAKDPFLLLDKLTYVSNIFDNYDFKLNALKFIDQIQSEPFLDEFKKFMQMVLLRKNKEAFLFFIKNLSNNKKNKLLIQDINNIVYLKDTIDLYSEYYEKTNELFDISEFNGLHELHYELAKEVRLLKSPNVTFNNKEIEKLDNHEFNINNNHYKIIIPKNSHEVLNLGIEMDICIGSHGYISTHLNGTHFILKLFKNNDLYAAVHCFKNGTIDQIKKHLNAHLDDNEIKLIESEIKQIIKDMYEKK